MLHTKFQGHQSIGSGEEDFYHIWAWRSCWSCDPTHLYKFSFLFPLKLSYELWFQIALLFLKKKKKQVLTLKSEWPLTKVKE